MLCLSPIQMKTQGFNHNVPCRQCFPCRFLKQKEWTGRIILESRAHASSTFATMTYNEENHQPITKIEMQLWQKRFRKELKLRTGQKCRFYTIGEYGTRTARPHYHSIIFGPDPLISEAILQNTWSKGFVTAAAMLPTHAAYIARYTTKKLQSKITPALYPEFAIMSRSPPLGSMFIDQIISTLKNRMTRGHLSGETILDKLKTVRLAGKRYPLSQLFRDRILKACGDQFQPLLAPLISQHFNLREKWSGPELDTDNMSARQCSVILNSFREHPNVS